MTRDDSRRADRGTLGVFGGGATLVLVGLAAVRLFFADLKNEADFSVASGRFRDDSAKTTSPHK
jgi:hypothetical protein